MNAVLRTLTRFCLAAVCVLSLNLSVLADPEGQWTGEIKLPGLELRVTVYLQEKEGQWVGSIDIPQQKAKDLPLTDIHISDDQISFKIKGISGSPTFTGQLYEDETQFRGDFSQAGQTYPVVLHKPDSAHAKVAREEKAKSLQQWKTWLQAEMQKTDTPGLAVAVVQDDAVLFTAGLGWRDREAKKPVTEDTLFAIGSSSKAFTASLIGMLVDEHQLQWDQAVQTKMPDFQLFDTYAGSHLTTRDLLIHSSGLPRHDLSWYSSAVSRDDLYQRIRYLEPTAELRQQFQYQNLMYMTAGILAEKVTGYSWEHLIQERIFTPLKMTRSTTSGPEARQKKNYARPYGLRNGVISPIPVRDISALGPAGSIHSSINDMTQWLRFNLGDGSFDEHTLLSARSLKDLQSPQIVMSSQGQGPMIPYMLYGMGWMIHPYRGHTLIQHGGNIDGFTAQVGLLPEKNLGLVILSNKDGDALPSIAMFSLLDHLLELEPVDWSKRMDAILALGDPWSKAVDETVQIKHTQPSLPTRSYHGVYTHPGYEPIVLQSKGQGFKLHYGNLMGTVKHWHFDTFQVVDKDGPLDHLLLQFELNLIGEPERLKIQLEPQLAPLTFIRQAEDKYAQASYLKQFVGTYSLQNMPLSLKLVGDRLIAQVPGQKDQVLLPTSKNTFRLKELEGYYIQFVFNNNQLEKALITQPGGNFEAVKK